MSYNTNKTRSVSAPLYGTATVAVPPLNHADTVAMALLHGGAELSKGIDTHERAEPGTYDPTEVTSYVSYYALLASNLAGNLINHMKQQFAKDHPEPTRWERARQRRILGHIEKAEQATDIARYHARMAVREAQMQGCEPPPTRRGRPKKAAATDTDDASTTD